MLNNNRGFTLVEMIAVMIIISIIGVIAASKFIHFDTSAKDKMADSVISELNTREKLVWSNLKLQGVYEDIDGRIWDDMQRYLDVGNGAKLKFGFVADSVSTGTINIRGKITPVQRSPGSPTHPAKWSRR